MKKILGPTGPVGIDFDNKWGVGPTGYAYFTRHKLFDIFIWISFILVIIFFGIGYWLGVNCVKTEIIETPKIIEREVKVSDCACIPCESEPPLPKCEFQSAVYQAISDQFDPITGYKLLEKGNKYYLTGDEFFTTYTKFCSLNKEDRGDYDDEPKYTNDCFYIDQIINKNLFKMVK